MTGNEIRESFLEFFRSRDHLVLPSAPLIPERDPTTLLISAGMQPLKPYFQGVSRPPAPRLTSSQKSFRTQDIEEVGDDRHTTFFEMLGNFAPTGDYFKEGAIPLAWELVTEVFRLPKEQIRVTIHPTDDEADAIWKSATDVRPEWVYRNEENWWAAGETGPCGPDSELWWDRGVDAGCGQADCHPDHCQRFLEFWNLVFMQFDRQRDGSLPALPRPGIDTGMGLERMASILQGVDGIYETDLMAPLVSFARANAARPAERSERLIADHLRGMTFLIGDGVLPGTEGRGYVLRRLIRRAVMHARRLGLRVPLADGVGVVAEVMGGHYPELVESGPMIAQQVRLEAERFERTLEQGMEQFESLVVRNPGLLPGEDVFRLHDTFGFPVELTRELAQERGIEVDLAGFEAAMAGQRARSRTMTGQRWPDVHALPQSEFTGYHKLAARSAIAAVYRGGQSVDSATEGDEIEVFLDRTPFYAESGGQIGDTGYLSGPHGRMRVEDAQKPSEGVIAHLGIVEVGRLAAGDVVEAAVDSERRAATARHHSATHLLHKALRTTLGETATQRGSYVGPDHTTFDFAFARALAPDELRRVGRLMNQQVRAALPFHESYRSLSEARESGAMALFGEKYGDIVRVVCFGDWTCELCGGTHVQNSADVGMVLIRSERSIGSGLRRIDLVAGEAAGDELDRREAAAEAVRRDLERRLKEAQKRVEKLEEELRGAQLSGGGVEARQREARVPLTTARVDAETMDDLRAFADRLLEKQGGTGVVAVANQKSFVVKSGDGPLDAAGVRAAMGNGGGPPHLIQGRLDKDPEAAFEALARAL
ncbi:MAG TPA: alanine--tRNA ligase [Candidatus Dormibacteraeota bacterium]|nr:alanine--tRNA ligase [Candidatus Dormibacteraeota bacterium]